MGLGLSTVTPDEEICTSGLQGSKATAFTGGKAICTNELSYQGKFHVNTVPVSWY